MKNKSLYLSLSVFSAFFLGTVGANTSFATIPSDRAKEAFSGFYVTGSVGHSYLSAKKDSIFTTGGAGLKISGGKDVSSNSLLYSVSGGYGTFCGPVYLSLEGGVFHDGHKAISSANSQVGIVNLALKETISRNNGVEFKVKIGTTLPSENILVYGALGVERSQFKYVAQHSVDQVKGSKSLWAIAPGVGMKIVLSEKLILDFNYSYSLYQKWKRMGLDLDGGKLNVVLTPSASTIRLGASFKF